MSISTPFGERISTIYSYLGDFTLPTVIHILTCVGSTIN